MQLRNSFSYVHSNYNILATFKIMYYLLTAEFEHNLRFYIKRMNDLQFYILFNLIQSYNSYKGNGRMIMKGHVEALLLSDKKVVLLHRKGGKKQEEIQIHKSIHNLVKTIQIQFSR